VTFPGPRISVRNETDTAELVAFGKHSSCRSCRVLSDPDWNAPPPIAAIPRQVVNYDIAEAYAMSFPWYFPAAG
jgi:hypothetical protein